jgi:hypothetical protein
MLPRRRLRTRGTPRLCGFSFSLISLPSVSSPKNRSLLKVLTMVIATTQDVTTQDTAATPKSNFEVEYRVAATRREREQAFHLVYNSYLQAGLGEMNEFEMRVTPYHLSDCSEIFVATRQRKVIFTMTLIMDGPELGVPMESVYGDEVNRLRRHKLRLGEVSCLADCQRHVKEFFPIFLNTSRLMVQYARYRGLDALVAAVHPKHARFYHRFMDFQFFGLKKTYPTVRNHPAVALWLEFARIDRELPKQHQFFFGEKIPYSELRPHPIREEDREYFRPMIDPNFQCAPLGDADDYQQQCGGDALVYAD